MTPRRRTPRAGCPSSRSAQEGILCRGHRPDRSVGRRRLSEETFAPVAAVCPFDTEAEVSRRANDSDYGLAAYVFTRDLPRAFRMMDVVEAGTIAISPPRRTGPQ